MSQFAREVTAGNRFEFGKNWVWFLETLDDTKIAEATHSLQDMLEVTSLEGLSFLDLGSGSGLFSLAARRLGARVHSFDYDPRSVACTSELKRRYFPDDGRWVVETGSALDADYLRSIGKFDIVYFDTFHEGYRPWPLRFHKARPTPSSWSQAPSSRYSYFNGHLAKHETMCKVCCIHWTSWFCIALFHPHRMSCFAMPGTSSRGYYIF